MHLTPLSAYPGGSFEFNNTPRFDGLSGGWNLVGGAPVNFCSASALIITPARSCLAQINSD